MWSVEEGWETWWLRTRDGRCSLFVAEAGEGEPVVVLHGGPGGDITSIAGLALGLVERHRVVLFDQRGSFRSRAPLDSLSFDAVVDDVVHLMAHLESERVHLVGHSCGALVAGAVVAAAPERVGRVALVAPGPLRLGSGGEEKELVDQQLEARRVIEVDDSWIAAGVRLGLEGSLDDGTPLQTARWERFRDAWLFTTHPERFCQVQGGAFFSRREGEAIWATVPTELDLVRPLLGHDQPVSVVLGDRDLVDMGARLARRWFPEHGPVDVTVIPGAGHIPWIDEPELTKTAVRRALAG